MSQLNMKNESSIFMMDNDEDNRNLFENALAEIDVGIHLTCVQNAKKARNYLKNKNNPIPNFIFLNLEIPGVSGRQCLIEIKKMDRLLATPVIVYTTSRNVLESKDLKKLGAAHFMSKPTTPQEIYYLVSLILEKNFI